MAENYFLSPKVAFQLQFLYMSPKIAFQLQFLHILASVCVRDIFDVEIIKTQSLQTYNCRGIMVNMVLCVIPGQGNSKILNLVKSGFFDSPIFLYIPNDEKTSTGHLI